MKKILLLLLLLFQLTSLSQNKDLIFQVLDKNTKEPISYITIILKGLNRGTHADDEGFFKIPEKFYDNAIIRLSSIGYISKELKLSEINKSEIHKNEFYKVFLRPSIENLEEIKVVSSKKRKGNKKRGRKRKLKAKQVVQYAINNILENYPIKPYSYIGYYRDYQQPITDNY
jgi:hypothetical protein